ncbi:unnamed protein product, partial [Prorocentrum cordatum]
LPARSLAQPRDSTRVVPAVPCCRSQPHCSSGSRGRDGKTAGLGSGSRLPLDAGGIGPGCSEACPRDRRARPGPPFLQRPRRPGSGRRRRSLRSAVTPAAQRSVRISVAGQFPPHLCVSHHQEGRGEPPAAVPRGDAAAPRGARHHSSCARPSVTSRLTQSLPRLPSAAASCSRTARPMDTAP